MAVFEMVKYHRHSYPADIPLRIEECAAHFDIEVVHSELRMSLHTEYSYGNRLFYKNALLRHSPAIVSAKKGQIPQLWKNEAWAKEFADFLCLLAGENDPAAIEVHPPFNDYTGWDEFISNYTAFEEIILARYPDVCLLIENRCGSRYQGGRFLVSTQDDVETLCNLIVQHNLSLRVAYDIPQIYTAHFARTQAQYIDLLNRAESVRDLIGGVHLWGKCKNQMGREVSHCGDLTSYFKGDLETKELFLQEFNRVFDDGIIRKMILEVNSGNDDLLSIISDLRGAGVMFA